MTTPDFLLLLGGTLLPLGVLWSLFWLVLRRERCYGYNRWLLLLAPPLAVALLLLPRPELPDWLAGPAAPATGLVMVLLPAISPGPAVAASPAAPAWQTSLLALYGLGVALALGRLAWQLARVQRLRRRFGQVAGPGYTLAYTGGQLPTSSFGSTIFWDETTALPPAEAAAVLAHEVAHVRQGHSYGLLWLEAWRAVLWFNPFAHLLLPALRLTHELLADAAAAPGPAAPAYSALLARLAVRQLAGPGYFALLQPFTFSFTLTRIAMLQKSTPVRRWKQWLALPVLGGVVLAACRTTEMCPAPLSSTEHSAMIRADDKEAVKAAFLAFTRQDSLRGFNHNEPGVESSFSILPSEAKPGYSTLRVLYKRTGTSGLASGNITSNNNSKIYTYVEQMPQLPGGGGTVAIVQAIQTNLMYPKGADGKLLPEAKAFISFEVGANGAVQNPHVIKSAGPAYDVAVIDAINKLPRFEPGRQEGKAVAVSFTVPVIFKP